MRREKYASSETFDLRRRQLEDCMYQNLQQRSYASISVQDLCQRVGISRRSYYNYFKDKDECVASLIERVFRECYLEMLSSVDPNGSPKEICTALMEYRKNGRSYMDIIVRNDLYPYMIRSMLRFAKEEPAILEMLSTPEHTANDYDLACFIGMQIAIQLQWYFNGYDLSPEEMAENFLRIAYSPALTKKD